MIRTIPFTIVLGVLAIFAHTAEAATLFFTPGTGEFGLNKEIVADLKIDSDGVGVNAGQATIRFPKDILEVKSLDKTDSAFGFWLEEPSFSNTDGVITFVGGTPYGISGASIQVLHIVFTTKNIATALVTIVDSAVTASDGSGTNVLSKTTDAAFTISGEKATPVITPPTQIKRESAPASGLPVKPTLRVPLYPNPLEWYGKSTAFTASWALPRDVSLVATAINKEPYYTPTESEGLFDNKMFKALSDGVWYLHVRFQNDIGWGPTAHYRIGVDTQSPLPFEITSNEGTVSDEPSLTLHFKTSDAVSGVSKYQVKSNVGDWTIIPAKDFNGTFVHKDSELGKHLVVVRAVDASGNSIEDSIEHEVLPIASPTFTFSTRKLFSDEPIGLSFKGTALPSTKINLLIKEDGALIAGSLIPVDTNGNWEFAYGESLRNGRYIASIQNIDARSAHSLIITAPEIQVTGRYTNMITATIVILITALIALFWFYKTRRERTSLRIQVAERDATNVFKVIETDIEKLNKAHGTGTPADNEFLAQKLKENVRKMGSYIRDEIDRAKE